MSLINILKLVGSSIIDKPLEIIDNQLKFYQYRKNAALDKNRRGVCEVGIYILCGKNFIDGKIFISHADNYAMNLYRYQFALIGCTCIVHSRQFTAKKSPEGD